jgi:hypothetical protein
MASTVVAFNAPPCSNRSTVRRDTSAARARRRKLHPRVDRAIQHCIGTIGTMVATPPFGQVCHVARFAYSPCGFETVPLRSNGSQSGASVTHRPHIRSRSRSSLDIASSQNCSISPSGTPARRMALITRSITRKSSPAASSVTQISGCLLDIMNTMTLGNMRPNGTRSPCPATTILPWRHQKKGVPTPRWCQRSWGERKGHSPPAGYDPGPIAPSDQ